MSEALWRAIAVAAEALFQHHGHHPHELCCEVCEPLKAALRAAQPGPFGAGREATPGRAP